nr:glycosyltransferase family 4 protein [uncultured Sediminibacterium sp.]
MKNIIFLTNLHVWSIDSGKGGRAFYNTILGYVNHGWNVFLITTGAGVPDSLRGKITVIERDFPSLSNLHNSSNKLVSITGRFLKQWAHTKFYIGEASRIIRTHKGLRFIIYSYEVESVKAGKLLARKFNFKLVTRFQGTILSKVKDTFLNRIRRIPHFSALRTKADLIIMTNDGTQGEQILKRLKNKSKRILFLRNGVDTIDVSNRDVIRSEKRSMLKLCDKTVFITVSRLVNWKRVDLAINGILEVVKQIPNVILIIVGDGPERQRLEYITRENKIQDKVMFVGAIEQSLIKDYLFSADIFLSYYDLSNLGNPIMEAMMAGLPIITIDVGDTKELIRHNENGFLIPNDQLSLIPQYMINLIEDKQLAARLANEAFQTARTNFCDWNTRIKIEIDAVVALNEM